MKFVALLSGGKDSIYSTLRAIQNGHELVCCAHLAPMQQNTEEESYMYQTAGSEVVRTQVEECIGVPFYWREIHGQSKIKSLVYENDGDGSDEVEDLYILLEQIKVNHPEVEGVSSGAILSTYQRTRIENVCSRLNLTSLSYLWRLSSQRSVLDSILDDGEIEAILVRVACPPGLMPYRHLGKSLRGLRDVGVLDRLKDKFGMHPAGEGGEYETMVLDCPKLFKRGRLVIEESEIICDENDDGVGILKIIRWSVEKKSIIEESTNGGRTMICGRKQITKRVQEATSSLSDASHDGQAENVTIRFLQSMHAPNVQIMRGGLCHVSALLAPVSYNEVTNEADAAVQEFLAITQSLQKLLANLFVGDLPKTSSRDILYVHLYLSEMAHFAKINQHYVQFFGTHLPPSRACVAVGKGALPGGRRVMMDCILQRGSGGYLRSDGVSLDSDSFLYHAFQNKHHLLRKCLHVQSISHWAPVCIGPYSQANTLRSAVVFLAGMIGLVPENMRLIEPEASSEVSCWEVQLCQSWKNAAAVLDGLDDGGRLMGGQLEDSLGALVYFSKTALESVLDDGDSVPWKRLWSRADCISRESLSCNGDIIMGSVDGTAPDVQPSNEDPSLYDENGVLYGGYEDEETWREMSGSGNVEDEAVDESEQISHVPLLMVCLPELPAKAQAEVELVCATRRAAACMEVCTGPIVTEMISRDCDVSSLHNLDMPWNTGYDGPPTQTFDKESDSNILVSSVSRSMGSGCASMSTVMASCSSSSCSDAMNLDTEQVLSKMIELAIKSAKKKDDDQTLFSVKDILNVRLYYTAASVSRLGESEAKVDYLDDGSLLRSQLHSVLKLQSTMYYHEKHGSSKASNMPAYTVVPVLGMHLSCGETTSEVEDQGTPLLAMQVFMCDMLRTEADLWIRYNR